MKKKKAHDIMKENPGPVCNDKLYFGKVDLPKQYDKDEYSKYFSDHNQAFNKSVKTLSRIASRRSYVDLVMISKGYSIDDLNHNQSEQFQKDLADSGKEAIDMIKEHNIGKLSEVFFNSVKRLAQITYPIVDINDPEAVAKSYDFSSRLSVICQDWAQIRSEPVIAAMNQSYSKDDIDLIASATHFNGLYHDQVKTIGNLYRSPNSCKPDIEYNMSMTLPVCAQLALDTFQIRHREKNINAWRMGNDEIFEKKNHPSYLYKRGRSIR